MALSDALGWLADLVAQHLYRNDVPEPQRRRWSLDGDGWTVVDDDVDEVLRISLSEAGGGQSGNVPSPGTPNTVLQSLDGTTVTWESTLTLGSSPSTFGEVRLGRFSNGVWASDGSNDTRLIDFASGIQVGDDAVLLKPFGLSIEAVIGDHFSISTDEELYNLSADAITHRLGSDTFGETETWGEVAGVTTTDNAATYSPGILNGVIHVIVDFLAKNATTDSGTARLIATLKVSSGTVAVVGAVTTVHDIETSGFYTPSITTDGTDIFATVSAGAAQTIAAWAKITAAQVTFP